jgi:hypothetical protein
MAAVFTALTSRTKKPPAATPALQVDGQEQALPAKGRLSREFNSAQF